jgi:hypothetical protein
LGPLSNGKRRLMATKKIVHFHCNAVCLRWF